MREPGVLCFNRFELTTLECGGLRVLDRILDRALAIGIGDACRIRDRAVMREHRGNHRVDLRRD